MSGKKKRAWFVCPQWQTLVADHYPSDIEAARALHTDPRVLAKLRTVLVKLGVGSQLPRHTRHRSRPDSRVRCSGGSAAREARDNSILAAMCYHAGITGE